MQKILALTLLLLLSVSALAAQTPNIVVILADDLGYNGLSCYGATRIKTPNIDRIAKEGILFTDGHCGGSTCTPTRYGLMTGRHTLRTWAPYSALSTSAPLLIEEGRVTVPSFLKSAGYATAIVGKWHLGFGREEGFEENRGQQPPNYWETRGKGPNWNGELKPGPLEVGFDNSYVLPVANSFPPYVIVENHHVKGLRPESPIGKMESKNSGKMEGGEGARWKDEELVDMFTGRLVEQLEGFAKNEQPFFLYYPAHQPHVPWRPAPRFKGTSQAGLYGDVIQELDWSVGVLLDTLERLEMRDNTLVIFASDNGAGGKILNGHRPNGIFTGGKGDLTEGGHRVPFVACWPGHIPPGTRSDQLVSLTDLLATFAAIVGKELPAGAGPDSDNILPALLGKELPNPLRPVIFSSGGTGALCIREGKWKLLDGQGHCGYREFFSKKPHPAPKPGDPPGQLYNLEKDPQEATNLYSKHPEVVHRLKAGLERIRADENYNPTRLPQPKEKLTREQLDALFTGEVKVTKATKDAPNILVIVVDDLGYADVSAYAHSAADIQTPNIDRLAARGVLFTNAYTTAPVCSPARAGWGTGHHQARWDPQSSFNCGLPKSFPHLAEVLKENGYATARIGKNDYSNRSIHKHNVREYPLNHGYDEFLGFSAHGHDYFLLSEAIKKQTPDPSGHSAVVGPLMHNRGYKEFTDGYLTEIFTDAAIEFLERDRDEPFFLTLAYNSVHHLIHQVPKRYLKKQDVEEIPNYDPKQDGKYAVWFRRCINICENSGTKARKYYLANLDCLDENIGRLLDVMQELSLEKNTLIFFFSDNGGAPSTGACNLPLSGSKFTLWEGGIRVPFILVRPGKENAGEICQLPISTLDIVPTCLNAAGIELPKNLDGMAIPRIGESDAAPRKLFWTWGKESHAVRWGDWKLLHNGGKREGLSKGTRLFNLRDDLGESRDLSTEYPKMKQRLEKMYQDWSREVAPNNKKKATK